MLKGFYSYFREELRRWFLAQELDLFRFRFQYSNNKEEKKKFLEVNNLHYEPVSGDAIGIFRFVPPHDKTNKIAMRTAKA